MTFKNLLDPNTLKIPEDILLEAVAGKLVLFVGNGLSRIYDMPSWEGLANNFFSELKNKKIISYSKFNSFKKLPLKTRISIAHKLILDASRSDPTFINYCYTKHLSQSHELININLLSKPLYKHLTDLNLTIVTTNYDNYIDTCVDNNSKQIEASIPEKLSTNPLSNSKTSFASHERQLKERTIILNPEKITTDTILKKGSIIHFHGSYSDPLNAVVTTSQYLKHYNAQNIKEFLEILFERFSVVFIGYGLEELEILDNIFRVKKLSNINNPNQNKVFHLMPLPKKQEALIPDLAEYYEDLGVRLIAYDIGKDNYNVIETILSNWLPDLNKRANEVSKEEHYHILKLYITKNEFTPSELTEEQSHTLLNLLKDDIKNLQFFFGNIKSFCWIKYFLSNSALIEKINMNNQFGQRARSSLIFFLDKTSKELVKENLDNDERFTELLNLILVINIQLLTPYPFESIVMAKVMSTIPLNLCSKKYIADLFGIIPGPEAKFEKSHLGHYLREIFININRLEYSEINSNLVYFFELFFDFSRAKTEYSGHDFTYPINSLQISNNLYHNLKIFNSPLNNQLSLASNLLEYIYKSAELSEKEIRFTALDDFYINNYSTSRSATILMALILKNILIKNAFDLKFSELINKLATSKYAFLINLFLEISTINFEVYGNTALTIAVKFFYSLKHVEPLQKLFKDNFSKLSDENRLVIIEKIKVFQLERTDKDTTEQEVTLRDSYLKLEWIETLGKFDILELKETENECLKTTNGDRPLPPTKKKAGPRKINFSPLTLTQIIEMDSDTFQKELLKVIQLPKEDFNNPIEELSNELEKVIKEHPEHLASFFKYKSEVPLPIFTAFINGFTQAWVNKLKVNWPVLFEFGKKFILDIETTDRQSQDYKNLVNSLARIIEAGCREDEHSFNSKYNQDASYILQNLIAFTPTDATYNVSNDSHTRALNEPRGVLFSSLIVLTLRITRLEEEAKVIPDRLFWSEINILITNLLNARDNNEPSLHSQLGYYYRQFLYLDEKWYFDNFNLIFPESKKFPKHWEAAIEGFSYNGTFVKDFYNKLNEHDFIYSYLRLSSKNNNSSDISHLNQQLIHQSTFSYLVGNEELEVSDSLISKIISDSIASEFSAILWLLSDFQEEGKYFERSKQLVTVLVNLILSNPKLSDSGHRFDLARLISLFALKDETTSKIIKYYYSQKDNSWGFEDIFDYLIEHYDEDPLIISNHFADLLLKSDPMPTWPEDKILKLHEMLSSEENATIISNNIEIKRKYYDSGFGGPFSK